jgi:hypothetical protein
LVIETPQANLVAGMKWLLGVYTKRFNIRHKLCGHLFAGRYKALMVEGCGNGYLRKELLAAATERVGPNHYGAERWESGQEKAERIVGEELKRLGWEEGELARRAKATRGR